MRVDQGWRPLGQNRTNTDSGAKPVQHTSFADVMVQQDAQRTQEQLNAKLQNIHRQGDRLAKNMTVRELMLYRQMVKQFLEDTIRRGIGLKEVRGFDRRGRIKRYKLLDEIDATLVTMAEDLLDSEQGRIDLLNKIGEIRGILINLLF
ncbi:YaaR family protein [Paenibacillus sp. GSMTC-2017]|uniref:YaaR family protein n=1 Tax=Paenibacillus sp. GSMTC-2017 TaxID=2794350 RepID=UPI0018D8D79B|nr:YaaR family protein [Paenibacillus sp. GSMTC-2017]MBH5320744.1 YaaR family protein [Paenibacillus sp. GSMTC-2017]